jgi:GNAT superfamily N-acetyltransferase
LARADIAVRWAEPRDAGAIARLLNALNRYVGVEEQPFNEAQVREHFFGARRVVTVLLAEAAGEVAGIATLIDFYNSDRAAFALWLNDLYVEEAWWGAGVAQSLMAACAKEALARGAESLWWGVMDENARAIAFYRKLGATDDEAHILELNGPALSRLAGEAP